MPTVTDWKAECEAIWQATLESDWEERKIRKDEPVVGIHDSNWKLQHAATDYYEVSANPIDNDTGTHQIVVPFDDPMVAWALDETGRLERGEGQNIHISIEHVGARMCGRLDKLRIETDEFGTTTATFIFLDDYENLKWYDVWCNSFLPPVFQAPRIFILPGPVPWILKTTLFLQQLREHIPVLSWNLADDPLNFAGMADLDMSQWDMVIVPSTLADCLAQGYVWGVAFSRFRNFHEMSHPMMEDAEYSWKLRRWFTGDPIPVGLGFTPRHGALIVDIEDHSGVFVGTAHGGSLADGLLRTVGDYTEDFLDTTYVAVADEPAPVSYFEIGNRLQDKRRPFVTYTPDMPGVIQVTHTYKPAKGIVINAGGHSMPGVNELISIGIQALFDVIGQQLQIGSIGGSVDTALKPFYEDTVLAWMSVKLYARSLKQGKSRYFEFFQTGADKAYTVTSTMVLRTGVWATRTQRSNTMEIGDGGPYLIGDMGLGHFWLGHRVATTIPGTEILHMARVRELMMTRKRGQKAKFSIIIGNDDTEKDPAQAAWERIEGMLDALQVLGVF